MAEQREASLKTSEHNAATSTLKTSPRKEDDDEAVISLLEINFGNENGRTGNHGPADTTGGASKALDTDASSCNSTAAINSHITTSIDTPDHGSDHGQISSNIIKGLPTSTEDMKNVRSSGSASIHAPVDEIPSSKLEVQLNVPVTPSIRGSTPSDEHAAPARHSELQEAFTDLSEKSDIVPDAGNICIPEETVLEATSATENLPAILEHLAAEISSTSPGSSDIVKPHLEGDNSVRPASPVPDSIILPHLSDDTNTQDNPVSLLDAYTHPSTSPPTPSETTTPTSSELDTSRASTLANSVTNTSIAAAFPLTFKHYHVFALPTAQPASPHEENSHSPPPVPPAGAFSAASVSDSTVPTDRELTVASVPTALTSTELSVPDVDDLAVSTAEHIPGPVISDSAASTDNPQIEDVNQEKALLNHTTSITKPDSPTTSAATHVRDYTHPLPIPTSDPEPVLASTSSICADVNVPASASTSEINEEIPITAVENIDSDSVGTTPMHEDTSLSSTTQDGVVLASAEAGTQECVRETSPERLAATFNENAALGPSTALSNDVAVTRGPSPAVGVDLQAGGNLITEPPAGFYATTISANSIASPTVAGVSTEHNLVLEEKCLEGNVPADASSALFDVPLVVPHPSSLSQADIGTQTEVVESPPGDSISEECSTVDVNANEVEQSEAAGSLDEHEQDCPDPLLTLLPSSSPPSSQDLVSRLHGSLMKVDENDVDAGEERTPDEMDLDMDLDDMLPPSSPLLSSSQPRASSPDRIFDSSPPDMGGYSPPSSPQPFSAVDDKGDGLEHRLSFDAEKVDNSTTEEDCDTSGSVVLGKRKLEEEEEELEQEEHSNIMMDLKKFKPEITLTLPPPPNPKRPTQASQKRQFKKLVKPFRSPLVNIEDVLAGKDAVYASGRVKSRTPGPSVLDCGTRATSSSAEDARSKEEQIDDAQVTAPVANKDRTAKVAKPFRAPSSSLPGSTTTQISTTSVTTSTFGGGRVQAAPTIQTLQARVQKLKQALKIKASVHTSAEQEGTDKLEVLTQKWRSVGREVAWLVWDSVKDVEVGGGVGRLPAKGGWDEGESPFACGGRDGSGSGKVRKGGFDAGWGYDDGKGREGWGWDEKGEQSEGKDGEDAMEVEEEKEEDEDERDVPQHTLGTMLRHMGIDPDTLGWNEDEGDFVDIDDE